MKKGRKTEMEEKKHGEQTRSGKRGGGIMIANRLKHTNANTPSFPR